VGRDRTKRKENAAQSKLNPRGKRGGRSGFQPRIVVKMGGGAGNAMKERERKAGQEGGW